MKKTKFNEICLKSFGDGFRDRNFVADVNIALATITFLSKNSEEYQFKDRVVVVSNEFELKITNMITEDGSVWDDIFDELKEEGLIENITNEVRLTKIAFEEIKKKYGEIIF
jgi:hypothetical protein